MINKPPKLKVVNKFIVMGDSAGGQIALSFAEYLKAETTLPQPGHIVMLSPVLDGTLSNPDAKTYERIDPMLGIEGSKYFIKLWWPTTY